MAHKFEIYKDKAGEFRVRFKYNSEVMFSTEGYSSKASAQNAIDSIKKNGPGLIDPAFSKSPLVVAGGLFAFQKVGGVQALMTSQGTGPTQRKRCGRRLSK
jgi:uncharacterized protein YegP (UPF0339 family)